MVKTRQGVYFLAVTKPCCYCGKNFTTLYAMLDGWACEKDWEIHEDRIYIQNVRAAEGELETYKKTSRFKEIQRAQQSGRIPVDKKSKQDYEEYT